MIWGFSRKSDYMTSTNLRSVNPWGKNAQMQSHFPDHEQPSKLWGLMNGIEYKILASLVLLILAV